MLKCGFWIDTGHQKTVQPSNDTSNEKPIERDDQIIEQKIRIEHAIKQKIEEEEWDISRQKLREAIGWKDFSQINNSLWRTIRIAMNRIGCMFKLPLVHHESIVGNRMSIIVLATIAAIPFELIAFASIISLFVCPTIAISMTSLNILTQYYGIEIINFNTFDWFQILQLLWYGVLSWFLFGITRIISIELNKTKSQSFVFAMFASVAAIITIITTIVCSK